MKKLITILSVIVVLLISSCVEENKATINVVSAEEMQTLIEMDNVQLLDVRTSEEYTTGYIAEAQNIDFFSPTFEQDIKALDKDKPVLLYCQAGGRSAKCAEKMKALGFTKIYDLDGGISKWKLKKLPITK